MKSSRKPKLRTRQDRQSTNNRGVSKEAIEQRASASRSLRRASTGDHLRTRLTHSIEVGSISRTIARTLSLNEDLAEAIALGHDLGHSPFGHSGEEMLAECMQEHGGFDHNWQSLRVVELLENAYP